MVNVGKFTGPMDPVGNSLEKKHVFSFSLDNFLPSFDFCERFFSLFKSKSVRVHPQSPRVGRTGWNCF